MEDAPHVKIVVVGDGAVGKSSLLVSYTTNSFPTSYIPTVFDNVPSSARVNKEPVTICYCDTAGQRDFDKLRPIAYPDADLILLCYSVVSKSSFDNVRLRWMPELKVYCRGVPIILVGTKIDLREEQDGITQKEGHRLAKMTKVHSYMECSALTQEGLDDVFEEALLTALKKPRGKGRGRCVLL